MKKLIGVAIGLFAFSLPLQAVSQTLEDQFNRQNNQLKKGEWIHDCSHWDKAQYVALDPFAGRHAESASINDWIRVRIHPNGRVLKIQEDRSHRLRNMGEEPKKCRGQFTSWTGKIGSNRKIFSDGSGWEVLTKKPDLFLFRMFKLAHNGAAKGIQVEHLKALNYRKPKLYTKNAENLNTHSAGILQTNAFGQLF